MPPSDRGRTATEARKLSELVQSLSQATPDATEEATVEDGRTGRLRYSLQQREPSLSKEACFMLRLRSCVLLVALDVAFEWQVPV